jgi:tRNA G18 (ribose-2'-O)-methylase SpoU
MRPLKTSPAAKKKVYIYGKHALVEALTNAPATITKVFLAPEVRDQAIRGLLEKHAIPTTPLAGGRGKELAGHDAVHQGVIALMNPSALITPLDTFLANLDIHL